MVSCGTITVEEPQPDISISSCSVSPQNNVGQNETVECVANLINNGDGFGSATVTFEAGGQQFGSRTVSVNAGSSASVAEQFTPAGLGVTGTVGVEATITGTFTEAEAAEGSLSRLVADGGRQTECKTCGE